jgi:hypothetical protein
MSGRVKTPPEVVRAQTVKSQQTQIDKLQKDVMDQHKIIDDLVCQVRVATRTNK